MLNKQVPLMPAMPALIECLERNMGRHEAAKYALSTLLGLSAHDDNKEPMAHVSVCST